METKPFSLQSPQGIAEDYGGDKQKIAQAMQMGILDPTAATLAGMFIDRMRSAAQAERAPQQTVAQQVFTPPAPPQMPMQAPQGAPAGLGALPPGAAPDMSGMMAPPPAPEMPMPQEEAPPMSMADGGLASLPVPDAMFDENSNGGFDDGYAGGGILAFAGGGMSEEEAWNRIKRLEGGLGPKGEMLVSSSGAVGPSQLMPATAPEAARIAGLPWDERRYRTDPAYNEALGKAYYLSRVAARGGDYAKGALDYHTGMGNVDKGRIGPEGRKYLQRFTGGSTPTTARGSASSGLASLANLPDIDKEVAQARAIGRREAAATYPERSATLDRFTGEAERVLSPEYQKQGRDQSKGEFLANLGFGMAGTKSPYFLQALGASATAALPGLAADRKAAKEEKRQAIRDLADAENISIARAEKRVNMERQRVADVLDVNRTKADIIIAQEAANFRRTQLQQQADLEREGFGVQKDVAGMRTTNPNEFNTKLAIIMRANPGMSEYQAMKLLKNEGFMGSSQQPGLIGVDGPAGPASTGGAPDMSIVSSRPIQ